MHTTAEDKKRVISILNAIKNNLLGYYLHPYTIAELHKIYEHTKMDSALSKNLNNRSSIDQMIDQIETYRNTKISKKQKKSIAERVKLRSWKRKKK